jgi:hypothetical protein
MSLGVTGATYAVSGSIGTVVSDSSRVIRPPVVYRHRLQEDAVGSESTPTRDSSEGPAVTDDLGWLRRLFAIEVWAGISMFVVGTVILGSLL